MLASGGSIRFGEAGRALASVSSRTMIERVVDAAEASANGLSAVTVRTAEQREHSKTAPSDRDVKFAFDDLEFERPLAGVPSAIDANDDPVRMRVRQPLLSAAAIEWLADPSQRRDGTVHSVQRRDANAHDALAINQSNGGITGLHAFDRRLAVDQTHDDLPRNGDLQAMLDELDDVTIVSAEAASREIEACESLTNVNTNKDLTNLEERRLTP